MNTNERERIARLLKQSLPPVGEGNGTTTGAQLRHDLWPAMLHRLQASPVGVPWFTRAGFDEAWFNRVWFDCALLAAVAVLLAFFPAAIPLLLYHL
ncbi:MAG: hypothetical protein WB562_17070 [Candidatus Sulfotelmatobacter sp.]